MPRFPQSKPIRDIQERSITHNQINTQTQTQRPTKNCGGVGRTDTGPTSPGTDRVGTGGDREAIFIACKNTFVLSWTVLMWEAETADLAVNRTHFLLGLSLEMGGLTNLLRLALRCLCSPGWSGTFEH